MAHQFMIFLLVIPLAALVMAGDRINVVKATINRDDLEHFHEILTNRFSNNVNALVTITKESSLHLACRFNSLSIVQYLLERNELVLNARNDKGETPLHLACLHGHLEVVKLLLEAAKRRNVVDVVEAKESLNQQTALFYAARSTAAPVLIIQYLMDVGNAKIDIRDRLGNSVVHEAVQENNLEAVEAFLDQKTSAVAFSLQDNFGMTPLLLAVKLGRVEVAKTIISKLDWERLQDEAVPTTNDTAIHLATLLNQTDIVEALLARNLTSALLINGQQQTPLQLAILEENYNLASRIITLVATNEEVGVTLAIEQDLRGRTALHLLAMECSNEGVGLAKKFVPYFDAVQNVTDNYDETVLETAVKVHCFEMVKLLLANDFDCKLQNRNGYTPLHLAKRNGFEKLANVMVATGKCSLLQRDACNITVAEFNDKLIDGCESIPLIKFGKVKTDTVTSANACIGTKLSFSCTSGYRVRGSDLIKCNREGKWVINGYCAEIGCEALPIIANGTHESRPPFKIGSSVTLCPAKTFLKGSGAAECKADGLWHFNGSC